LLVASPPFDRFSHKQLWEIVSRVTERLYQLTPELSGRLGLVKFQVRERILGLIERGTDRQTQEAFVLRRNRCTTIFSSIHAA